MENFWQQQKILNLEWLFKQLYAKQPIQKRRAL